MTADPTLEFEHYLAQKLGMLVADLRERMSSAEFLSWEIYYARLAQDQELATKRAGGRG